MKPLTGKVAIVSGAGRGIGSAIALKLASAGAAIVVNDRDREPAEAVVRAIVAAGGKAVACAGDVLAPGFAEAFVEAAVEAFGGLDIVVNNAGYTWDSVIQKTSDEQWEAMIGIHLTAPFQILRAAQPVIGAAARLRSSEPHAVREFMASALTGYAMIEDAAAALSCFGGDPIPANVSGLGKAFRLRDGRFFWRWDPQAALPKFLASPSESALLDDAARALQRPLVLVRARRGSLVTQIALDRLGDAAPQLIVETLPTRDT